MRHSNSHFLIAGLVIAAGVGAYALSRKKASSSSSAPEPTPFGPHPPNLVPLDITSGVAQLEPGETYLATVDIPFLAEALVGSQAIRKGLEDEGFVPITVTERKPSWWPESDDGDWYIVASYTGEPRARELPGAIAAVWTAEAQA